MVDNIHGIVFLGTPHLGSRFAGWAKRFTKLLRPLGSNPDIFLELEPNATAVSELHNSFLTAFSDLQMTNFYENRETRILTRPSIKGMVSHFTNAATSIKFNELIQETAC